MSLQSVSAQTIVVVKVQCALYPADAPALVYARGREHTVLQRLDRRIRRVLGDDVKGYFRATWNGTGWKIGARVADQGWGR